MLVEAGHSCTLIGHDFVKMDGHITQRFDISWRKKPLVILRALLQSGHYTEMKYDSVEWRNIVQDHLRNFKYDTVIISFIWMDKLLGIPNMPSLVIFDTQNSEWKICKGYQDSKNPLVSRLGRSAAARLDRSMAELPEDAVLMHIAESDVADHCDRRPDMNHIVVMPGIEATPRTGSPDYSVSVKELLFCGNLSNRLNNDAVNYFASEFWPLLRSVASFTLAGSNPSRNVQKMAKNFGWTLIPNFSDEEKMELYNRTHFAVLPLPYGAGSKIKLLEAVSYGVPVLTTHAGATGGQSLPSFVTVEDSPEQWLHTIMNTVKTDPSWYIDAISFGNDYNFRNTMKPLFDLLGEYARTG